MLLLTKQFIPAALADESPMCESSITTTRAGSNPKVSCVVNRGPRERVRQA